MSEIVFREGFKTSLLVPQEKHAQFLTRGFNRLDVTQYLGSTFPMHLADEREWLATIGKRKTTDQMFLIGTHEQNRKVPVGTMGLHRIDWVHRTATTGAAIFTPAHQGRGVGGEAKMLLLKYAFDTLGLRKIKSGVLAFNQRSYKYNLRCGYIVEGTLKDERFKDGVLVDELIMAVTRERWLPIWKRYQDRKDGSF